MHDGLARHAGIWAVLGLSTEFWKTEFWRGIEVPDYQFTSRADFMTNFMEAVFGAMDPNALLVMGWKWQHGDVTRHTDGDLAKALGRITSRTMVMPIDEDMFFPVRDCAAEQALVPSSELRVLPSIAGHFGLFGFEQTYLDAVDAGLRDLLDTPV